MGFFADTTGGNDRAPIEDFSGPPEGEGELAGRVTDADTGGPLAGVEIAARGPDTGSPAERLAATTDADGRYVLPLPPGTYPAITYDRAGYGRAAERVTIAGSVRATRDVALRRNWAALDGGATVIETNDDGGAAFNCGAAASFDRDPNSGWSAARPGGPGYPADLTGQPPRVTLALPRPVDVDSFELLPDAVCGDDLSAALTGFRIEISSDGERFVTAREGELSRAETGRVSRLAPRGDATRVSYVRLTMLSPRDPEGRSGRDFIDLAELAVLGRASRG